MLIAEWTYTSYGTTYRYKAYGGYSSTSYGTVPNDISDVQYVFNNSNTEKYHLYNNLKLYNSAIYFSGSKLYACLLSESVAYNARCQTQPSSSSWYGAFDVCDTLRGTLYSSNNDPMTRSLNVTSVESNSDLPYFTNYADWYNYITTPYVPPVVPITSNGGGATHIAKVTGQLSSLSNNLSDILMVSGGGGGGLIIGEDVYAGKDAGGIAGSGNNSANQTTGYAFGQGESDDGVSGGGGGLYGGYKGGTS